MFLYLQFQKIYRPYHNSVLSIISMYNLNSLLEKKVHWGSICEA